MNSHSWVRTLSCVDRVNFPRLGVYGYGLFPFGKVCMDGLIVSHSLLCWALMSLGEWCVSWYLHRGKNKGYLWLAGCEELLFIFTAHLPSPLSTALTETHVSVVVKGSCSSMLPGWCQRGGRGQPSAKGWCLAVWLTGPRTGRLFLLSGGIVAVITMKYRTMVPCRRCGQHISSQTSPEPPLPAACIT